MREWCRPARSRDCQNLVCHKHGCQNVVQGSLDDGRYVTLKYSVDGGDILVALGHHDDLQPTDDHVHAWNQHGPRPDHHDTRWSAQIFPGVPGKNEHKNARREHTIVELGHLRDLTAQARAVLASTRQSDPGWPTATGTMKELQQQWNTAWRDPKYKFRPDHPQFDERHRLEREFRQCQDEFYEARRRAAEERKALEAHTLAQKTRIADTARSLASSTDWKDTAQRFKQLAAEWKQAGRCRREDNDRLWEQFRQAQEQFFDRRTRHFEQLDREAEHARREKQNIVAEASRLASSTEWKAAGEAFRKLQDRWKASGRCKKEDNDRLWEEFNRARETFQRNRDKHFDKLKAEQAQGLQQRQAIVREARSAAQGSDLRAAGETLRSLMERWKAAPHAPREEENRLWQDFQRAQDHLRQRRDDERRDRERKQAQAKTAKERIISRVELLCSTNDFKSARQELKSLSAEWKTAGRASRDDEDHLWQRFNSARDRFNNAADQAWERAKRERIERMTEAVQRQRNALATTEDRIRDTESRLSDLMSRPDPSYTNPRRWEIVGKRNESISRQRSKLTDLQMRRRDIIDRLVDMESKLRSMY